MSRKTQLVSVICVIVLNVANAHENEGNEGEQAIDLSAEEQQVVDTLNAYAKTFAGGDIAQIEHYFFTDEQFSSFEGTSADWGWESYRGHLAAELPSMSGTQYRFDAIRPHVVGDLAYATLDYAMDVTVLSDQFEGGKHPVSMRGVATVVLARDGDVWKIRHLHTARKRQQAAPTKED